MRIYTISSTKINKKNSFGAEFSEDFYPALDKVLNKVFTVEKALDKRAIKYFPKTRYQSVKKRLQSSLNAIDKAFSDTQTTIYPYINSKKQKGYFAINTSKSRHLLAPIKLLQGISYPENIKIQLGDIELLAYNLQSLEKRGNWLKKLKEFLIKKL